MQNAQIQISQNTAEAVGWRRGKPIEDPEKTKRWGFVTAKPSEYLVHVRRGKVRHSSSGQGASCFKWPWDAVAIVPTSFQRLMFRADQVTREKVGVEIVGLAVYRIAEPLIVRTRITTDDLVRCEELGAAMAAGLALGIY